MTAASVAAAAITGQPTGMLNEPSSSRVWRRLWPRSRSSRATLILSSAILAIVVLWWLLPGLFTSFDPIDGVVGDKYLSPSAQHWFGTDQLGRDVFARVVHGTGQSVSSALIAVAIGLIGGSAIGLFAGFWGGALDSALMRVIDVLLAIPSFLLAMTIVVSLGFATVNVAIAVGASSVAIFARLMRAEVLKVKNSPFVEASFLVGGSRASVLLRHVLPNAFGSAIALSVLQFGSAILSISALAFLGYGNPPPAPDWGLLVADGRQYLATYPYMVFCPGLVIVVVVLALNRLSATVKQL